MNRAERRRAMRAAGWRGAKAKRQPMNHAPRTVEADAPDVAVADEAARQSARTKGLFVPPSPAEAELLRLQRGGIQ